MDPISWCIIGGVAVVTSVTTYFVSRHVSSSDNDSLHEHINNQILIEKEKDTSHEFAQTLILAILAVLMCIVFAYWSLKCVVRAMQRQFQAQVQIPLQNQNPNQIIV